MNRRREFIKQSVRLSALPLVYNFNFLLPEDEISKDPFYQQLNLYYHNRLNSQSVDANTRFVLGMAHLYHETKNVSESQIDRLRTIRHISNNLEKYGANYDETTLDFLRTFSDKEDVSLSVAATIVGSGLGFLPFATPWTAATVGVLGALWDPANKALADSLGINANDFLYRLPYADQEIIKSVNLFATQKIFDRLQSDGKLNSITTVDSIKFLTNLNPDEVSKDKLLASIPVDLQDTASSLLDKPIDTSDSNARQQLCNTLFAKIEEVAKAQQETIKEFQQLLKASREKEEEYSRAKLLEQRSEFLKNEFVGTIQISAFIFGDLLKNKQAASFISKAGGAIVGAYESITKHMRSPNTFGVLALTGGLLNSFSILGSLFGSTPDQFGVLHEAIRQLEENILAQLNFMQSRIDARFDVLQNQQVRTYNLLTTAYNEIRAVRSLQENRFNQLAEQVSYQFNSLLKVERAAMTSAFNKSIENLITIHELDVFDEANYRQKLLDVYDYATTQAKNEAFSITIQGNEEFQALRTDIVSRSFLRYSFGTFPFFNHLIQTHIPNPVEWIRGSNAYIHYLNLRSLELKPQNKVHLNRLLNEGMKIRGGVSAMFDKTFLENVLIEFGEAIGVSRKIFTELNLKHSTAYDEKGLLQKFNSLLLEFENEKLNKWETQLIDYGNIDTANPEYTASPALNDKRSEGELTTTPSGTPFVHVRSGNLNEFILSKNHPFIKCLEYGLLSFNLLTSSPYTPTVRNGMWTIDVRKDEILSDRFAYGSYQVDYTATVSKRVAPGNDLHKRKTFKYFVSFSFPNDFLYKILREEKDYPTLLTLSQYLETHAELQNEFSEFSQVLQRYEKAAFSYYLVLNLFNWSASPIEKFSDQVNNFASVGDTDKLELLDIILEIKGLAAFVDNYFLKTQKKDVDWVNGALASLNKEFENHLMGHFYDLYFLMKNVEHRSISLESVDNTIRGIMTFMAIKGVKIEGAAT